MSAEMVLTVVSRCVITHVEHIAVLVLRAINSTVMDTRVEVSKNKNLIKTTRELYTLQCRH